MSTDEAGGVAQSPASEFNASFAAKFSTASNAAKLALLQDAAKFSTASNAAKLALLQELTESIERMEQELSPTFEGQRLAKPNPAFPAQLSQYQMVTVPKDGLCLSHACVAAFGAKHWLASHGEDGWRNQGTRSQQEAEEQQAKRFLASVVHLMHEYAQFDPARSHYHERASRIAAGALPEDYDLPFYAACLNGCIEVVLLGYAAYQKDQMVGTGPLRIAVGNEQALGDDGRSTGHFILLQSWLPMEEDLQKREAFPFGVRACFTLDMPGDAHFASEPSASSSSTQPSLHDALHEK